MTLPKIIGLAGLQGVGKSTAARYLCEAHGYVERSFAGPLKRIVQQVYEFSAEQMFGDSWHRNQPDPRYPRADGTCLTPRQALELFGTEAGRACWEQTWVAMAMREARELINAGECVVFADARFANEFSAIFAAGGSVVRLTRAGRTPSAHASETEQHALPDSLFSAVIPTDGSITATRELIDRWLGGA